MRKKGFTLIELVMVIVIIGILAAVAVPRFINLRNQARVASCQSDVAAIRSALTSWYAEYSLNNGCPGGNDTWCNDSGYPVRDQLSNDSRYFAQNFFVDAKLPPTAHITNTLNDTWDDGYAEISGSINMTQLCPQP